MERCIVTGAAGFIGSHLCEFLAKNSFEVVGIDNFSPFYSENLKRSNIRNLLQLKNFSFIEKDMLEANMKEILDGCDFVFHLAAQPGVRQSWSDFQVYTKNNIQVTQRILESCRNACIKRFVFASSSSVYGNQEHLPVTEESTLNPSSPYGVSKLACEALCKAYSEECGLPVAVLRYFTVYGPRQRPDMLFHRAIKSALLGEPVEIYGDGNQTRDFTYVSDVVSATAACMKIKNDFETLNISGGSRISVNEAVDIMTNIGMKIKTRYVEKQGGDVKDTFGSIEKAKCVIGYNPVVTVTDGLKMQVKWMEDFLRQEYDKN